MESEKCVERSFFGGDFAAGGLSYPRPFELPRYSLGRECALRLTNDHGWRDASKGYSPEICFVAFRKALHIAGLLVS